MADEKKDEELSVEEIGNDDLEGASGGTCGGCSNCSAGSCVCCAPAPALNQA